MAIQIFLMLNNDMNALLFPGQGSQLVGMGKDFYDKFSIVKEIFKEADDILNFKISKIILQGPEEELILTQNTQPAILIVSYSIFKVLKKEFNFEFKDFKFFAGHSLGEYSALVCSDSLKFNDALYLLYERGKAMQEAVPLGSGNMIAVLGTKIDELNNLIVESKLNESGVCEISNDNANGQVILSGDVKSINLFQLKLKDKKIKYIPLKVSAPFHCKLMKSAADKMRDKIEKINFSTPTTEIINNVNAKPYKKISDIKELLTKQIYSTVQWRESLNFMSNQGVKNYIEIGPGKALSGMVKRTLKNVKSFSINSLTDIEIIINELQK